MPEWKSKCLFLLFLFSCIQGLAQPPKLILPIGHTETVYSAQFSPDGKYILTISKDKTAKLWDAATGILLNTLKGHHDQINSAVFSPPCAKDPVGGRWIATASADASCRIWETLSGRMLYELPDQQGSVNTVLFNKTADAVLTVAADKSFRVWDLESGKVFHKVFDVALRPNAAEGDFVVQAQYSPDGKSILSSSRVFYAQLWDAATGKLKFNFEPKGFIESAAFSNDGKWLATDHIISPDGKNNWFAVEPGAVKIWNAQTGKLYRTLRVSGAEIVSLEFSPDNKFLVVHAVNKATVFNTATWEKLDEYPWGADLTVNMPYDYSHRTVQFNPVPGSDQVLVKSGDTVMTWNLSSGKLQAMLEGKVDRGASFRYSPDGKRIVSTSRKDNGMVWDATTGKLLFTLRINGELNAIHSVIVSPTDKWILTVMENGTVNIWETATGKWLNAFRGYNPFVEIKPKKMNVLQPVGLTLFSPDEKYIITYQNNDTARLWERSTAKFLCSFNRLGYPIENGLGNQFHFDTSTRTVTILSLPDSTVLDLAKLGLENLLLMGYGYFGLEKTGRKPIITWKSADIKSYRYLNCSEGSCESRYLGERYVAFCNRHNWVATVTSDNIVKIIEETSEKEICHFFSLDSADYFTQVSSGHYLCTAEAAKLLHYVTSDLTVISFEQLDVRYNRPDLVLETLGNTDTGLIGSYRNAYNKRIRKLGIDTSFFNEGYRVPTADLVNREAIPRMQNKAELALDIHGSDSTYTLDRFNIWINEVPVFGMQGCDIKRRFRKTMDTTITVILSAGDNRIETSVTSLSGAESYRKLLFVKYQPDTKQPARTWFIGIGINHFADSTHDLKWCVQDIRDLARTMQVKYGDQFVVLDTLFNERVTLAGIKALRQKLMQTGINDRVIISYSGHGLLSKDYDYYLSSYSVNFTKPDENGIPYEAIENLLDSIPARQKLLLLDACHSGEVDKEELQKINSTNSELQQNKVTADISNKGVITGSSKKRLGLQNSFDLMQSLFVNVGKGTGAIIISASGGVQFAQERSELGHGVFTYSVIEAMNQFPTMKVSAFKKFVGDRVFELTKGLQRPTTRNETIAVDWDVW